MFENNDACKLARFFLLACIYHVCASQRTVEPNCADLMEESVQAGTRRVFETKDSWIAG